MKRLMLYIRLTIGTPILFMICLLEATLAGATEFYAVMKDAFRHIGKLWRGTL